MIKGKTRGTTVMGLYYISLIVFCIYLGLPSFDRINSGHCSVSGLSSSLCWGMKMVGNGDELRVKLELRGLTAQVLSEA